MSSLPHYIEFLPQCKVLLCHIHGHCLTRSEIVRHLEKDHESSPEICRRASQASGELDVAVTRTGIISPAMDASPIKGLAVQEGFRCTANDNCKFLSTKLGSFQSHLSQKHGIAAWGGQSNLEFLKQNVSLQNFFPSSKPFYFCVGPGVPTSRAPTVPGSDQRRRMYEALDSRGLESEGLVDQEVGSGVGGTRRPRGQEETQGSRGSPALTLNQPFERRVPSYPNTRPTACAPSRPVRRIETVPSKPLPAGKPSFAQVLVFTERRDTAKIHLCLASDLIPIDSANATSPSPMDVDFDRYRRILVEEKIMGSGLRLEFVDTSGRKVQITNQMTFRAAVVCQAAQNVEMIAFSSEPIARPPPFEDSRASLPVSAPAGNFSAHTVFRTERPDTEKTHICLASDLRASVSNTINVSPMHVDFDRYCSILREVEVFDDGLSLGFIDANGKRIPIMNQMMFRAAVSYQVYQRPDMITFNAEPIALRPAKPASPGLPPRSELNRQHFPRPTRLSTTPGPAARGRELLGSMERPPYLNLPKENRSKSSNTSLHSPSPIQFATRKRPRPASEIRREIRNNYPRKLSEEREPRGDNGNALVIASQSSTEARAKAAEARKKIARERMERTAIAKEARMKTSEGEDGGTWKGAASI